MYASSVAADDAYRTNRDKALAGLGANRSELEKGADLLSRVGKERRTIADEVIDDDIKRWNYYENLPANIRESLLGASAAATGLAEGANYAASLYWGRS